MTTSLAQLAAVSEQPGRPSQAGEALAGPILPPQPRTILLAEDDDVTRHAMARLLRKLGFQVLDARDGQEALELAEWHAGPIHLLVTDRLMPRLNGLQLAAQIRESRPRLPVLLTSGEAWQVAPGSTEVEFLAKPCSAEQLLDRVSELLARADGEGCG